MGRSHDGKQLEPVVSAQPSQQRRVAEVEQLGAAQLLGVHVGGREAVVGTGEVDDDPVRFGRRE